MYAQPCFLLLVAEGGYLLLEVQAQYWGFLYIAAGFILSFLLVEDLLRLKAAGRLVALPETVASQASQHSSVLTLPLPSRWRRNTYIVTAGILSGLASPPTALTSDLVRCGVMQLLDMAPERAPAADQRHSGHRLHVVASRCRRGLGQVCALFSPTGVSDMELLVHSGSEVGSVVAETSHSFCCCGDAASSEPQLLSGRVSSTAKTR